MFERNNKLYDRYCIKRNQFVSVTVKKCITVFLISIENISYVKMNNIFYDSTTTKRTLDIIILCHKKYYEKYNKIR